MNISSVNSSAAQRPCQPIKPVSFQGGKSKAPSFAKEVFSHDGDMLGNASVIHADTFCSKVNAEDKFDMACLVAGYYKTQYENLLKENGCIV